MSKYFHPHEFKCKCGRCKKGFAQMDVDLLERLEMARMVAGVPFVITSAMRCADWNEKVGGIPTSSHLDGYAVDLSVRDNKTRYKIFNSLIRTGFHRIGIYKNFIHTDLDPSKPANRIWWGE